MILRRSKNQSRKEITSRGQVKLSLCDCKQTYFIDRAVENKFKKKNENEPKPYIKMRFVHF